jgi:hypothetical protein
MDKVPFFTAKIEEHSYILENNFDNVAETVATLIINKIISYTFTDLIRKQTDRKIPNHCFRYVTKMCNDFLSCTAMLYERDDTEDNHQKLFYDSKYYGINDWKIIDEPVRNFNLEKMRAR